MTRAKCISVVLLVVLLLCLFSGTALAGGKGNGKDNAPGQVKQAEKPAVAQAESTDKSGDSRGKSQSVPDSDGKGADHGLPGPDKPENGGDGNNGSGNDSDCEDDNNGVGVPGHCKPKTPEIPPPETLTPVVITTTTTTTPTVVIITPIPPAPPSETRRVCVTATSYSVEGFPSGKIGDESVLRGEAPDRFCLDTEIPGEIGWLLWSKVLGHNGPRFSVIVAARGPTIELLMQDGRLYVQNWDGTFWLDMMFNESD